jgi:glycosyltransferase involved in cell wall biosynthesis
VYDVVDDYAALTHYRRLLGEDVDRLDREATVAADLVFVTSKRLARQRRPLNGRCVEVGNAADVRLFATARSNPPRPADLGVATGPVVCFHGTLSAQKLDGGLLARVAARRPGWTFVLLGHEPDRSARKQLGGLDNVRLLGLRPQQELPAYLGAADAAIVPYRVNDYTLGIDALKAYECLAAGLPVVATDLPCFAGLEPQVRTCRTDDEFDLALEQAITAPPPRLPVKELDTFSWTAKAARQLAEVRRLLAEGRP